MKKTVFTRCALITAILLVLTEAIPLISFTATLFGEKDNCLFFPFLFDVALAEETDESAESEESANNLNPEIHEDFFSFHETNSDIVGWLNCGETIDYPVVQRDNSFYLNHNFKRKRDKNGTLFVNECNTFFPRDDVLLIHGHNMKSGAMFGKLQLFMNYEYLCQYPIVSFRTIWDKEDVYYTPIAVFNASMIPTNSEYFDITRIIFDNDDDETLMPKNGFSAVQSSDSLASLDYPSLDSIGKSNARSDLQIPSDDVDPVFKTETRKSSQFQSYLDELAQWSLWAPAVDVKVDDDLLILVTCSYYQDDGRLMLVCRALRDDESREEIEDLYALKLLQLNTVIDSN